MFEGIILVTSFFKYEHKNYNFSSESIKCNPCKIECQNSIEQLDLQYKIYNKFDAINILKL